MPTRNIYDVVHTLVTGLLSGDHHVSRASVGVNLTYEEAEECVAQHACIQPLGAYDIVFVGRAWYDDDVIVVMEKHVPVGLL